MPRDGTLKSIWRAIRQLNPGSAVWDATRSFTLAVVGASEDEVGQVREFLVGANPTQREYACSIQNVKGYILPLDRSSLADISRADLVLATVSAAEELASYRGRLIIYDPQLLPVLVRSILDTSRGTELQLPLASCFPPFRQDVSRRVVRDVAKENALFVITTALGGVVPSVLTPILGLAEAASDTVFLTANQVRMLFLLGAAHGERVGYIAQWREIGSIVGAAFGWRALARELVSKIPFGGGLVPKGMVAYAGTVVVGEGIIFAYTTGRRMTRDEVGQAFRKAYLESVESVKSLVGRLKAGRS